MVNKELRNDLKHSPVIRRIPNPSPKTAEISLGLIGMVDSDQSLMMDHDRGFDDLRVSQ